MEKIPLSTKIPIFSILTFAAIFATISIYVLWAFAAIGGGYIQGLVTTEVSKSVLGTFGNSALIFIIQGSGMYLFFGVWAVFALSSIKLFESDIINLLKRFKGNDL